MRPRSFVHSVILYHFQDKDGEYIPTKIEINFWVAFELEKRGGHVREAKKHSDYKVKVLKFKVCPKSSTMDAILVQHAYT